MAAASLARWFGMVFLSGLMTGVPVGLPPLPEDPALSRAAPEKCLWYFSSAGMATPDPDSENQTEQLLAEPELQELAAGIEQQILRAVRREARGREDRVLAAELPKLIKTALTRPVSIYISEVRPPGNGGLPDGRAGLVANLGDHADGTRRSLARLMELAFGGDAPEPVERDGILWHRVPLPEEAPPVEWAMVDGYLVAAAGDGEAAALAQRLQGSGSPPDWLAGIRSDLGPDRVSTIGYLNVAELVEVFSPFLGGRAAALSKLGVADVAAIYSVSGLDELACVNRTKIAMRGEPRGVFALLPQKPLSKRDLELIPHDAIAAAAIRVDVGETLEAFVDLVAQFEPDARDDFEDGLRELEREIGVDLQEDILAAVDDVWLAYLPDGDVLTSWVGATAIVKIKDAERLEQGLERFLDRARMELGRERYAGPVIRKIACGDQTIHFISVPDDDMPFAPAWCLTDEYLVVGLMPQTVKSFLTRDEMSASLADVPEIADAISSGDGPACIAYLDTERVIRGLYPLLQIGARVLCGEMRQQGVDVDISLLPSVDSIARHMTPGVSTWAKSDGGFVLESRQALPVGGDLASSGPIAVALLLPAVTSARSAARENVEINNLRQLVLAWHNYASAHGESFPTNIYDEDGKPLLSWRVRLLPYLEEGSLYEEFHLDEPWDSEHNKKLIDQMPPCLSSPQAPELMAAGKTRYVALAGEETLFPGNKKLTFASVRDGTSKTILFVRATPNAVVIWTKPQDIDFDPQQPKKGIDSQRGVFLAAFCDAHVRHVSIGLPDKTIRAFVTRAGGEVINE